MDERIFVESGRVVQHCSLSSLKSFYPVPLFLNTLCLRISVSAFFNEWMDAIFPLYHPCGLTGCSSRQVG